MKKTMKRIPEGIGIVTVKKTVLTGKIRRKNLFGPDLGMKSISEMPAAKPGQGAKM